MNRLGSYSVEFPHPSVFSTSRQFLKTKTKIIFLAASLLLTGNTTFADSTQTFRPQSCTTRWAQNSNSDYLYSFSSTDSLPNQQTAFEADRTSDYENFIKTMEAKNLRRSDCHKTWTVLIYMTATSDLIPYALADLNEMEAKVGKPNKQTGSSIRTDVIVQYTATTDLKVKRLHMFEDSFQTFHPLSRDELTQLSPHQIRSPLISSVPFQAQESEEERLAQFLQWGIENYPSEHYLVIIWGHGRLGQLAVEKSSSLGTPNLAKVLDAVSQWSGDRVDILAADACYWMAVEDIDRISKCTQYVCGSADVESYAGFPYGSLLRHLNSGKFSQARTHLPADENSYGEAILAAWTIPYLYKKSFDPQRGSQSHLDPSAGDYLTSCSVSSKHLRTALIPSLNQLGTDLLRFIDEKPIREIGLKALIENGEFFEGSTQDLGTFLKTLYDWVHKEKEKSRESITTSPSAVLRDLETSLQDANDALTYTLVNSALGHNYIDSSLTFGPKGLAIWLPRTEDEFKERQNEFSQSSLYSSENRSSAFFQLLKTKSIRKLSGQIPGWGTWMRRMYGESSAE